MATTKSVSPKQLDRLERAKTKVGQLVRAGVQMNWDKASDTALEAKLRSGREKLTKAFKRG